MIEAHQQAEDIAVARACLAHLPVRHFPVCHHVFAARMGETHGGFQQLRARHILPHQPEYWLPLAFRSPLQEFAAMLAQNALEVLLLPRRRRHHTPQGAQHQPGLCAIAPGALLGVGSLQTQSGLQHVEEIPDQQPGGGCAQSRF